MDPFAAVFVALHLAASLVLAAYGVHRLVLAVRYLRHVRPRPGIRRTSSAAPAAPAAPATSPLPTVTVQIPLYNERYVAERAILAAGALDYPPRLLEIQVLDDSTDETTDVVTRAVARLHHQGIRTIHLRRPCRTGYKAGALAQGLQHARGDLIAVFDADFVPRADFLRNVVGEFRDPGVGMVQARWGHLNAKSSLLTRAQALQLDAHFTIEHGVRAATGCFFNFNGTAGVWRRKAIDSAGGWRADTLTEDLDLSYRAQLAGWRFVYRDDIEVPAELPVEVAAYQIQQQRWAQGGVQTARQVLPAIARAALPNAVKREAFCHLTSHFTYPILVVLALASLAAGWAIEPLHRSWVLAADGALLAFATTALAAFYGTAARARSGGSWWRRLALVPVIMVLGMGISIGQTVAVCRGLTRTSTPFRRTPKYRLEGGRGGGGARENSWRSAGYRVLASRAALLECALGLVVLTAAGAALLDNMASPTGAAVLFGIGIGAVGCGTLAQDAVGRRSKTV